MILALIPARTVDTVEEDATQRINAEEPGQGAAVVVPSRAHVHQVAPVTTYSA